jgi:N-methylhydantoinase A/oxoprolinase/acetone carboxylase beta subunit
MKKVLGIDTGGTFTDAVLWDPQAAAVLAKAKAPTTHDDLKIGIGASIDGLEIADPAVIDRVVLSTTLATNAIVEGQGRPTGLILIGGKPKGDVPAAAVEHITGKINIKGREVMSLVPEEVTAAVASLAPRVEAMAVSGMMSVRNSAQELAVKAAVRAVSDMPVVCGHELSTKLGYTDRTVTAVLNASLIPIIAGFVTAVTRTLADKAIAAPVFIVKGDGSLASLDFIREKPIETILSGPAASILGALALAGTADGIVVDMGGTTTDTGVVQNNTLTLSPVGAKVGSWQTQVDSAKLATYGLGGDTAITPGVCGPKLTTHRVLPACRGGAGNLTPTDLLCARGQLDRWDAAPVQAALQRQAEACGMDALAYAKRAEALVLSTIADPILSVYEKDVPPEMPVVATGAPVGTWYAALADAGKTDRRVMVPEHYEVANAVGAATAAVAERVDALVRPDEANDGFAAYIDGDSAYFKVKTDAVAYAEAKALDRVRAKAERQGSAEITAQVHSEEITRKVGWRMVYVETRVKAVARAGYLKLAEEAQAPAFVKNFD